MSRTSGELAAPVSIRIDCKGDLPDGDPCAFSGVVDGSADFADNSASATCPECGTPWGGEPGSLAEAVIVP